MNRTNLVIHILAAALICSCAGKQEIHDHQAAAGDDWEEMDEFHMIMAETFHPYKDSANLDPAKSRAGELAAAANRWASAELPARVANDEIRSRLERLKADADALAESIRTEDDQTIASRLTEVHDTFHEIQEAWYGGH